MRRVASITFLNHSIAGALTLLIPLLLLANNVNLSEIGIVLSVLPLVFLVARLLFAAVADQIGWSHIFLLANWPATIIATLIYYFATSLPFFFAGRVVEGLRESSYWAVNRTAIFQLSPHQEGHGATKNDAIIWLATAVGSAAAGAGIAYAGFSWTLMLLTFVSATLGIPAAMLWKTGRKKSKLNIGKLVGSLNPRGKGRVFWLVSVTVMFNSLATYPIITLLLPVFMDQQLGYSYLIIGLFFMIYSLIVSFIAFLSLKTPLNRKRAALQSVVALIASALLANSGFWFPACLFGLAFVRGLSLGFFEHVVAKVTKDSKNVSVDIGLLHAPMRLAEFASVLAAGFIAQAIGYESVFIATGVFFAIFSLMSLKLLAPQQRYHETLQNCSSEKYLTPP